MKPLVNKEAAGTSPSGLNPDPIVDPAFTLEEMRSAQASWAATPVSERVGVVRRFRYALVEQAGEITLAVGRESGRAPAEVLSAEIMPLVDACRFLERQARGILASRKAGVQGRPLWLMGTTAEVHRQAFGLVMVIAPSNYPVFLPGVQVLQALTAGNAVLLKPGLGGSVAALMLARLLSAAGLATGLLRVLPENPAVARTLIRVGVDKVIFTGSAATGAQVLHDLAERATPATMELSGCDAVIVRQDADLDLAVRALVFGLTLNEGRTCIGPRRVFVARSVATEFEGRLAAALANARPVELASDRNFALLPHVMQALGSGAHLLAGELNVTGKLRLPLVLCGVPVSSRLLRDDFFAPVMSVITFGEEAEAVALAASCPYALGATIFSRDVIAARALARRLPTGVVVINDMIVPTADPRLPFGGRRMSGFGVTRGREGLLEMTLPKVISVNRSTTRPHLDPVTNPDGALFGFYLKAAHGRGLRARLTALFGLLKAIVAMRPGGVVHDRNRARHPESASSVENLPKRKNQKNHYE